MPTRSLTPVCLAMLCTLTALCAEPAPPGDDEPTLIVKTDGTKIAVLKVTQDDYLYVAGVGKGGGQVKVPSHAVKDVLYADRNEEYNAALEKMGEQRFTLAALYFRKAFDKMPDSKWAQEYCMYGIGAALYASGNFNAYRNRNGLEVYASPAVYFADVLKTNPRSRFLPDIAAKLPVCLIEQGKLDEAAAALLQSTEQIKKYRDETIRIDSGFVRIASRAHGQLAIAAATLAEHRALAKQGEWLAARERWYAARTQCADIPDLWSQAVVGLLRTLLAAPDLPTAQAEAASLIEKYEKDSGGKEAVLAAAYMTLGKAHLASGITNAERGQTLLAHSAYAEARWAFLHVVGVYFDDADQLAEAHFFAGVCHDRLREIEGDAAQNARREWQTVVDTFPKSASAFAAERELARTRTP